MSNLTPEERNNFAFLKIIDNDDDFTGYISYVLYKKQKVDFIIDYKSKHNVHPPKEELDKFQQTHCTQSQIDLYRNTAEGLVTKFFNVLDNEKAKEFESKVKDLKKLQNNLEEKEKKLKKRQQYCDGVKKTGFWFSVLSNSVASLIFMILIIIVFLYTKLPNDFANHIISKVNTQEQTSKSKTDK